MRPLNITLGGPRFHQQRQGLGRRHLEHLVYGQLLVRRHRRRGSTIMNGTRFAAAIASREIVLFSFRAVLFRRRAFPDLAQPVLR